MCCAQVRGLFPLFSQLKTKDWWYLCELVSMISKPTNSEWKDDICELCWAQSSSWRSPLWLKLTAQSCATGTSPVCFCNPLSAAPNGLPIKKHSSLTFSGSTGNVSATNQWLIEAVELVHTGNHYVPGCTAQNGIYWMSQWFEADLILCMITENDVRHVHVLRGSSAPDDKVEYMFRHRYVLHSPMVTTVKSAHSVLW